MNINFATHRDNDGFEKDNCLLSVFISLFNSKSSGTISIKVLGKKLEIDVKHCDSYNKTKFYFSRFNNKGRDFNYDYYEGFIPLRWKCEGLRVSIYKLNPK
jgi:hypothetical protein